ncbi:MAG: hypothetical protein ACKVOR_07360 [Flavobacteriales bacterium]
MRNKYLLTLLHWVSTVLIGAVFSGIGSLPNTGEFQSNSMDMLGIMVLCVFFAGMFSLPVLAVSIFVIPALLKRMQSKSACFAALCSVSMAGVVLGYGIAAFMLNESIGKFTFVLVGYVLGTIASSLIWTRIYKLPTERDKLKLDTLDSELMT